MMSFIWGVGHGAVDAVFKAEADALLGPAGKRKEGRARQNGSLDWLPTGGGEPRLVITRVPVLIGAGIPLFGSLPHDVRLRHVATRSYASGLVQSEYEVVR